MIFLELFATFFKIGLFSFGGGYAMIPLISDEIARNGWMMEEEFIRIIGIAEMTPGPIAVNSATFVGYQTAGVFGSIAATFGVALPSLLIILSISSFFFKNMNHPVMKGAFKGIKPVVAGLIVSAAVIITKATLFKEGNVSFEHFQIETLVIVGILLLILRKVKLHPIMLIGASAGLGCLTVFI